MRIQPNRFPFCTQMHYLGLGYEVDVRATPGYPIVVGHASARNHCSAKHGLRRFW